MASPINKMNETSVITHCQKFKGHTDNVWGVIHLPDGQRIITCSMDGSLRVWNLKSGKQIGDDWRDGDSGVMSIALSPDGNKVVSGSWDGIVRLWDIDTCKVITKWMGHANGVGSVCWSRDGRRVLSGSQDGTAKQWDVHSAETILEPIENILASIETRHERVWAVVYSPDTTMIATGGMDGPRTEKFFESSVKIWDAKTGKLIVTLNGHTDAVRCLAWTKDGKTLISGSYDSSIRTWNTTNWEQTAVLEHTSFVYAIALSPNSHILASVSRDWTARLWNLENGQLISSPIQHAEQVNCVSFSADGKRLATGCNDKNAYIWDVTVILREAGLDDLLLDPKANKLALHLRPPAHRVPQGFFNGVPPSHLSAQSRPHSSALSGSTLLERLFRRSPSNTYDTSPSSRPDWAHNLLIWRGQSGKVTELGGCTPAVMEVPYAKGKRRNACAREKRKRPLPPKNTTAGSSHLPKPNIAKPPLQTQGADSSSTTHAIGDATITTGTTSVTSCPDITIRQAGLWTRFWLLICCTSTEYTGDGHH